MGGDYDDPFANRALLFVQMLSPPLPMLCRDGNGEEKISSSHDLLFLLFGRLMPLPASMFEGAYTSEGFHGDWKAHILKGKHAFELLEKLIEITDMNEHSIQETGAPLSRDTMEKYMTDVFFKYTRKIVSLAMGYDIYTSSSSGRTTNMPDDQVFFKPFLLYLLFTFLLPKTKTDNGIYPAGCPISGRYIKSELCQSHQSCSFHH